MSTLADRLQSDLKDAMKAKDTLRLAVIRSLKTALTNASIEKGVLGTPLDDAETTAVIRRQVKQRQDSIEQFSKAGRDELAEQERTELEILHSYLPPALSEDELTALVESAIAETGASSKSDMGQVMKLVQERAAGRADGRALAGEVSKRLA